MRILLQIGQSATLDSGFVYASGVETAWGSECEDIASVVAQETPGAVRAVVTGVSAGESRVCAVLGGQAASIVVVVVE